MLAVVHLVRTLSDVADSFHPRFPMELAEVHGYLSWSYGELGKYPQAITHAELFLRYDTKVSRMEQNLANYRANKTMFTDPCRYTQNAAQCLVQSTAAYAQRDWHRVLLCLERCTLRIKAPRKDGSTPRFPSVLGSGPGRGASKRAGVQHGVVIAGADEMPPPPPDDLVERLKDMALRLPTIYANISDALWYIGDPDAAIQVVGVARCDTRLRAVAPPLLPAASRCCACPLLM